MKYQKKYLLLLATKLVEKVLDSSYAKEYYKLFLENKNKKIGETTKNNYSATKNYRKLKYYYQLL